MRFSCLVLGAIAFPLASRLLTKADLTLVCGSDTVNI
jgi:hypothetical protein